VLVLGTSSTSMTISLMFFGHPRRKCRKRSARQSTIGVSSCAPFQSAFGNDIFPAILDKAAALFHSLIANHAFVDGNKRTAVTAFDHFFCQRRRVGIPNSTMYDLATETASYVSVSSSLNADAMAAVISVTTDFVVPIASFKSDLSGIPVAGSFQAKMKLRSWIRKLVIIA